VGAVVVAAEVVPRGRRGSRAWRRSIGKGQLVDKGGDAAAAARIGTEGRCTVADRDIGVGEGTTRNGVGDRSVLSAACCFVAGIVPLWKR